MKGIILAGGTGSRLHPMTVVTSKHLLPVYNKPMIYYPISTLMLAGIRDILLITTPEHKHLYQMLLGDGRRWGISIEYIVQDEPEGLPNAFILGRDFIAGEKCCLLLGDNFFYGQRLGSLISDAAEQTDGATVFAYWVKDPQRYGVLEIDKNNQVKRMVEKPKVPPSNWAVTGIYIYSPGVSDLAASLKPSARGETEITDLNNLYLNQGKMNVELMSRGFAWMDMGTPESLLTASNFVRTIEEEQGLMIACMEEIALHKGFITREDVLRIAEETGAGSYSDYLRRTAGMYE